MEETTTQEQTTEETPVVEPVESVDSAPEASQGGNILDRILHRDEPATAQVDNGGCVNCGNPRLNDEQVCDKCGFDRKLFNP